MKKCDNCPQYRPPLATCLLIQPQRFTLDELSNDLLEAIKQFYVNDIDLLNRSANEVCITSHIFHYFSSLHKAKYSLYNIDPEYNRNGLEAKYYCRDHYAKPDMIIHKRNCNKHNLLYIEFKVDTTSHCEHDQEKIRRFVSNEYGNENQRSVTPYRYQYGVSVILKRHCIDMLWFENGSKNCIRQVNVSTHTWEVTQCPS